MSDYDTSLDGVRQIPPPFDSSLDGAPGASSTSAPDLAATTSTDAATPGLSRWDDQGKAAPAVPTPDAASVDPVPSEAPTAAPSDDPSADEGTRHVSVVFRDALDLPIEHLEITIPLPDGSVFTSTTTAQGAVTLPIPAEASASVSVKVKDTSGALQSVCSIDLAKCDNAVIVRSPKVVAKAPLRQHQQTTPPKASATKGTGAQPASPPGSAAAKSTAAPASAAPAAASTASTASGSTKAPSSGSTAWWGDNGTVAHAWAWLKSEVGVGDQPPAHPPASPVLQRNLSQAGQPVSVVVGPECPNPLGLRLGRNNLFRAALVAAGQRLGLVPQALCALIECEAGKVTEHIPTLDAQGKPVLDRRGHARVTTIRELWNASAGNATGAAGLTQFLASTWLTHVLRPGFYVHDQSASLGWVKPAVAPARGVVFVLANGMTTATPLSQRSDANVQACLAKRFDPTWSINAAADYGIANLKVLEARGFALGALKDMERAKMMYLLHHEGEGAGPAFIHNSLASLHGGVAGLRSKFNLQVGQASANTRIADCGGSVEVAYRKWLAGYIDNTFSGACARYFCTPQPAMRTLSELLVAIGGQAI